MQLSGFRVLSLGLLVGIGLTLGLSGCSENRHTEKEIGQLATLTRTVMNIVFSEYIESPKIPRRISEGEIRNIISKVNTEFDQLKFLDQYEMEIVSDDTHIAAIMWDPKSNRKILQDLRCTSILDEESWRHNYTGNEFTLDWKICYKSK